ncbi:MAG: methyltransferase domain-containing protein, partial [Gammaproteobacteria bacterium]
MLNRRALFGSSALGTLAGWLTPTKQALAGTRSSDLEPRGSVGRLERLPRLDLESREDFLTGFRIWVHKKVRPAAAKRANAVMRDNGQDPRADIPFEQIQALIGDDYIVGLSAHLWINGQQLMWKQLQREFHGDADAYLAEMEAADKAGPGTLELDPEMELPEYTTHEIHMQPGGYVGDPFAGHIYHYGTNNFWLGKNYQDEMHGQLAEAVPTPPADGKVLRILDLGCSVGQMSIALKERYPDAEVWGIDVGGPMVRYAHMRAADLGVDVNFAQRLAEDTKFPDNHFDIVTSFLLFHEVTSEAAMRIIKEAHRITRPGGVFFARDPRVWDQMPATTGFQKWQRRWIWRWNHEVWMMDHLSNDYPAAFADAGFDV